jgi:hypothetical protein
LITLQHSRSAQSVALVRRDRPKQTMLSIPQCRGNCFAFSNLSQVQEDTPDGYNPSMLARLRSFALLVPVLLLVFVLYSWARSYLPDETFVRSYQGRLIIFFVAGQYVQSFQGNGPFKGTEEMIVYSRRVAQVQSLPSHEALGFEWTNLDFKSSYPGFIAIPYWAIAILLAALSVFAVARWRSRRQRLLPGHCRACGYDLRGSGDKCPECGQDSPPQSTPAAAIG